ncbi:ComEA family DNA-binding protein [Chloroflexota bacterium]
MAGKLNKYWFLIAIFLVAVITVSSIVVWSRYSRGQPIEISVSPEQELQGEIYIGGAIVSPGFYPLKAGDSIEDIIEAAGNIIGGAGLGQLRLYVSETGAENQPQKIDINRAEAWLLEALPGIGEVLAQRIIDYRQQNGSFKNINELSKVDGIGVDTCDKIKHLVTVAD